MFFFFAHVLKIEFPESVSLFLQGDSLTWDEFEALLSACRKRRPDITVSTLRAFIFIARRTADSPEQSPTIKELAEALELSHGTARRHCEVLESGPPGRAGLEWIVKVEGEDARSRRLAVSPKGMQFLSDLVSEVTRNRQLSFQSDTMTTR